MALRFLLSIQNLKLPSFLGEETTADVHSVGAGSITLFDSICSFLDLAKLSAFGPP